MFGKLRIFFRLFVTVRNWPTYLLRRFGRIRSEYTTYHMRGGAKLQVRTHSSDTNVFNDLWMGGVYHIDGFDWSTVKTVVDVGAHIGVFTVFAAVHAPQSRIVACEPEPQNLALLRSNVALNHLKSRVDVKPMAVAAAAGTMKLNVMPGRGECNSLYRQTEQSYVIEVPVTTLADVFRERNIQHCDILKMNCEGAEYEIFYGLSAELYKKISCMIINYHFYSNDPKHHPRVLQAHLEHQGFTVTKNPNNIFIAVRT